MLKIKETKNIYFLVGNAAVGKTYFVKSVIDESVCIIDDFVEHDILSFSKFVATVRLTNAKSIIVITNKYPTYIYYSDFIKDRYTIKILEMRNFTSIRKEE